MKDASPWVDVITNALDAAAFLMVTIDLYGKERLEKLRQRILAAKLERFDPFSFRRNIVIYNDPKRVSGWREVFLVAAAVIASMLVFFLLLVALFFILDLIFRGWSDATRMASQWLIDILYVAAGFVPFAILVWLIWLVRMFAVRLMIYLSNVFHIEGMMVVIGTFIFIASRFWSIAADWPSDASPIVRPSVDGQVSTDGKQSASNNTSNSSLYVELYCQNKIVEGHVVSANLIQMPYFGCAGDFDAKFNKYFGRTQPPPQGWNLPYPYLQPGDPTVTMNVHLADEGDEAKMQPGKWITFDADIRAVTANGANYLIADDARHLNDAQ